MPIYYRCIFQFTDDKYKDTPASNIFMRDNDGVLGKDFILQEATKRFKNSLADAGFAGLNFKSEVFEVSEAEVEEHRKNKGHYSARSMN